MKLAIDTNVYRALDDGDERLNKLIVSADRLALPVVVLAEIQVGIELGSKQGINRQRLMKFMASPRLDLLEMTAETALYYAQIFVQLRKQGTPIPTNDIWIAALCVQHGYPLATLDSDFKHVPLLQLAI
jgi:tRNA(fMet)-specific endonuclease VapC